MEMTPWDKVDSVIRNLPLADQPGWARLTPQQQQFVAMSVVEGQITNGGFHAVFYNNCVEYLELALAGYEAIGAKSQAKIIREVLATVRADPWSGPPETWPDPDAEEPPAGSKDIGAFDESWYVLDDRALSRLKAHFIDTFPEAFPAHVQ